MEEKELTQKLYDTKLPSSTHLCCLLVALLDVLKCTPASAPRRRLSAPSNATWYEMFEAAMPSLENITNGFLTQNQTMLQKGKTQFVEILSSNLSFADKMITVGQNPR